LAFWKVEGPLADRVEEISRSGDSVGTSSTSSGPTTAASSLACSVAYAALSKLNDLLGEDEARTKCPLRDV